MKSPVATFETWLFEPAPAERLALVRIVIGAFVTGYMVVNVREFDRLAGGDPEAFDPVGIARVLDAPLAPAVVWLLFGALLISGSAFTIGVGARVTGPAFAALVLCWTSYHSSWGQLLHFEHLFTIHVLILALAPTAEAWAPGSPAHTEPDVRYGWPLRLLAIATAIVYVLSGIAKLRHSGLAWFSADTLATHIGYSATRMETIGGPEPPLASIVLEARWLIPLMATAALVIELGAPIALLGGKARNLWVISALLFHAGTAATMFVFFGYRGLGVAMVPFFHVEHIVRIGRERVLRS